MLEEDIIEPASGPWAAPVVIVPKASGEPRFCVDYRGLNHVTVKDRYPLPRVDESLDFLARGKFISTIALVRGYWQFKVLPFGLCNSPATFQRLMNTVLAGLVYKCCAVYLDDVVTASPTFDQHLLDLGEVFTRLESAGLSLKLGKCQFPVTVYTDHSSLKWLMSRPNPTGRLARWCLRLQDFDIRIIHKPGTQNQVPDALSRNPVQSDQGPTDLLP
ncbi:hypothetical protein NFI96_031095 [Prochilodus magdalenae]|nr:hypothetical protein NFI96_031095 [Prochilodus magdalenae]